MSTAPMSNSNIYTYLNLYKKYRVQIEKETGKQIDTFAGTIKK